MLCQEAHELLHAVANVAVRVEVVGQGRRHERFQDQCSRRSGRIRRQPASAQVHDRVEAGEIEFGEALRHLIGEQGCSPFGHHQPRGV